MKNPLSQCAAAGAALIQQEQVRISRPSSLISRPKLWQDIRDSSDSRSSSQQQREHDRLWNVMSIASYAVGVNGAAVADTAGELAMWETFNRSE